MQALVRFRRSDPRVLSAFRMLKAVWRMMRWAISFCVPIASIRRVLVQARLIAFEGEQIIGALVDDALGDLLLRSHRVDRDDRALEVKACPTAPESP